MPASKRVVLMRLIRYVTVFCDSLWMLANQRLSYRLSTTSSATRIEFAGCCWVVPALIRSLSGARRELKGSKLVADADQSGHMRFGRRVCRGCLAVCLACELAIGCCVAPRRKGD